MLVLKTIDLSVAFLFSPAYEDQIGDGRETRRKTEGGNQAATCSPHEGSARFAQSGDYSQVPINMAAIT